MGTQKHFHLSDQLHTFRTIVKRGIVLTASTLTITVGYFNAATAAEVVINLPPGEGCPGFGLRIHIVTNDNRKPVKVFKDEHGNIVRTISTGKGNDLTFTNLRTNSSLHIKANGSNAKSVINADGSETFTNTGHNVLIMFPTDIPAGPSTIQYTGKMIYTVRLDGVFVFEGASGKQIDICTAID
jgi:hypothetical protein